MQKASTLVYASMTNQPRFCSLHLLQFQQPADLSHVRDYGDMNMGSLEEIFPSICHRHACLAASVCFVGEQARLMVPRLLDVIAGSGPARDAFLTGWNGVPLLAFLPWAATMLSLLGQDAGDALLPLLKVTSHSPERTHPHLPSEAPSACRHTPACVFRSN